MQACLCWCLDGEYVIPPCLRMQGQYWRPCKFSAICADDLPDVHTHTQQVTQPQLVTVQYAGNATVAHARCGFEECACSMQRHTCRVSQVHACKITPEGSTPAGRTSNAPASPCIHPHSQISCARPSHHALCGLLPPQCPGPQALSPCHTRLDISLSDVASSEDTEKSLPSSPPQAHPQRGPCGCTGPAVAAENTFRFMRSY